MPLRLVVAPRAQSQIEAILRTSAVDFGEAAGARYRLLLTTAFRLLAQHPNHAASKSLSLDHETVRLFNLRHARHLARQASGSVRPDMSSPIVTTIFASRALRCCTIAWLFRHACAEASKSRRFRTKWRP
ncbi:MAG: type II toxin-antitoxin system RelE/ParE family toxin [Brevundimonas sp.]|nr:type II toxin-antitoxin system RelE/ParE family toxin [Brevundimonas sp.]